MAKWDYGKGADRGAKPSQRPDRVSSAALRRAHRESLEKDDGRFSPKFKRKPKLSPEAQRERERQRAEALAAWEAERG